MMIHEAQMIAAIGTAEAIAALRRGDREAALTALSWANDDDVIDAMYDADMQQDGSDEEESD